MVPDLDLQLQVAIKALTDAIASAIDPANKVAAEQLHLTVATLTMVRDRLPIARRFTRRQLEDDLALLDSVRAQFTPADSGRAAALGDAAERARSLLADPETDTVELENYRGILAEITVSAIAKLQAGPAAPAVERIVLDATRRSIERRRAWCIPAGFEPYPADIPAIGTLI